MKEEKTMKTKNSILILREEDLRKCVQLDTEVISVVEKGFSHLWEGNAEVPPIIGIDVPESNGDLDIKTAHIHGLDSFAVKIASGFYDNPKVGLPVASGMMVLISTRTGFPQAVLLDNGYLTQVRTGAAGAIAAKYLAPDKVETVGMIGAGTQGRFQMMGLSVVKKFDRLMVYDLDADGVDKYIEEMTPVLGVEIISAKDEETLVRESDLVVTATPSHKPHIKAEWLHPGMHITTVGSDSPSKQELEAKAFDRVDIVACDLKSQSFVRGELHHAIESGVISPEDEIFELGELISDQKFVRNSPQELSICDLTGVGVQDTMIARIALQKALSAELGIRI